MSENEDKNFSLEERKKLWELATNPYLISVIMEDLGRTVKRDVPYRLCSLYTFLSMYLKHPINLLPLGPSGIGKTYTSKEVSKYFPEKDVFFGEITPKALIYDRGTLVDSENIPISEDRPVKPRRKSFPKGDSGEKQYQVEMENYATNLKLYKERLRNSHQVIDLSSKTLVFAELPSREVMEMLLPTLSHDKETREYKYVDETLKTKTIVIKGFPASIFLSTKGGHMEAFFNRCLSVTPESSKEKIEEAKKLTSQKDSAPWDYEETENSILISDLIRCLRFLLKEEKFGLVIPFVKLGEIFPSEIRDMRGYSNFHNLLKSITALSLFQRPVLKVRDKLYVISSVDDVLFTLALYSKIYETTRTGVQEEILRFYHNTIKKGSEWQVEDLTKEYNLTHTKKVSSNTIRHYMRLLSDRGYIDIQDNILDKRKKKYIPLIKEEEKLEIVLKLETPMILRQELEKQLDIWIEKIAKKDREKEGEILQYKFLEGTPELKPVSLDASKELLKKNFLDSPPPVFAMFYKELFTLESYKKSEIVGNSESKTILNNSESEVPSERYVLGVCSLCGESKVMVYDGVCERCRRERARETNVYDFLKRSMKLKKGDEA